MEAKVQNTQERTTMLIVEPNGYDFGYDWALLVVHEGSMKLFFLGQDIKVCSRLLGQSPQELNLMVFGEVEADLRSEENLQKLGQHILDHLLTTYKGEGNAMEDLMKLQEWDLVVQ